MKNSLRNIGGITLVLSSIVGYNVISEIESIKSKINELTCSGYNQNKKGITVFVKPGEEISVGVFGGPEQNLIDDINGINTSNNCVNFGINIDGIDENEGIIGVVVKKNGEIKTKGIIQFFKERKFKPKSIDM